MNLPDIITIELTAEDMANARGYGSTSNCLLATAVRRHFPGKYVSCGGSGFRIGEEGEDTTCFYFDEEIGRKIFDAYSNKSLLPFTVTGEKQ